MIAAWGMGNWRVVRFDSTGRYLGVVEVQRESSDQPPLSGFVDQPVNIMRFMLPDQHLGIVALPDHLQQFVANPEEYLSEMYAEEEMESGWEDESTELVDWFSSGRFVFRCHEDFWMNPDGSVNSH